MSDAVIERVAAESGLAPETLEQALDWLVTVWSREATPDQLQALAQWRAADGEHERAWQRVQQINGKLSDLPPSVAGSSLRTRHKHVSRRNLLRTVGLLMVGGAAAYTLRDTGLVRSQLADISTSTGEIREHTLADGTRLTINTASALNVHFIHSERRIELIDGEVLIATAPDPSPTPRPFVVETFDGNIRPIGTRFNVRRTDEHTEVAVLDGAVRIQPSGSPDSPARLDAGRQATFSHTGIESIDAAPPSTGSWSRHLLVVERMRLADFLKELDRYRTGMIRCHPAVADLIVSGTYPLPDTDRVLQALARALPIRISTTTRYWVVVEAAGQGLTAQSRKVSPER